MEYRVEKLIGCDDNYVVLQVNNNNKSFIVNVEQFLFENEEIEKYFNVQDVINGKLFFDTIKSTKVNIDEMNIEQEIYKFSSFSRLCCKIIKRLDKFKYIAKIVDDVEIVILSKKSDNFEIGNTYLIEGYFWLFREEEYMLNPNTDNILKLQAGNIGLRIRIAPNDHFENVWWAFTDSKNAEELFYNLRDNTCDGTLHYKDCRSEKVYCVDLNIHFLYVSLLKWLKNDMMEEFEYYHPIEQHDYFTINKIDNDNFVINPGGLEISKKDLIDLIEQYFSFVEMMVSNSKYGKEYLELVKTKIDEEI